MTGAEPALVAAAIASAEAGTAMGATAAAMAAPTAAGLGAAGTSMMGAGMGAGMGGGTAGMFGGAGSPMAAGLMAPEAAAPMFTEAAALGAEGIPMGMDLAMAQPALSMGAPAPVTGMDRFSAFMGKADPMMKGMSQASKLMGGQQQPTPHAQRPAQTTAPTSNAEIMQRMQRRMPGRSNFAGLLGNFGGY